MRLTFAPFLALLTALSACTTPEATVEPEPRAPGLELAASPAMKAANPGGYFVTLQANIVDHKGIKIYDGLYDALDKLGRARARTDGALDSYIESLDETGYVRLGEDDDEIECDRARCLVRLSSTAPQGTFASEMTAALAAAGVVPHVAGTGQAIKKTYVLGTQPKNAIECTQSGFGDKASFACKFDLSASAGRADAAAAELAPREKGKLAACDLSPGTVKVAEDAKAELDGAELVPLLSGASAAAKTVGFLRIQRAAAKVELIDLYLCGDVSHDYFALAETAKDAGRWLGRPIKVGAELVLDRARQEEAGCELATKITEEAADAYVLEVKMKLVPEPGRDGEVFGQDHFFLRLPKTWLR